MVAFKRLAVRRDGRRVAGESTVRVLGQAGLQPVQSGGAAGLKTLGKRQGSAVVSPTGNAQISEDNHVRAAHLVIRVDGRLGRDL